MAKCQKVSKPVSEKLMGSVIAAGRPPARTKKSTRSATVAPPPVSGGSTTASVEGSLPVFKGDGSQVSTEHRLAVAAFCRFLGIGGADRPEDLEPEELALDEPMDLIAQAFFALTQYGGHGSGVKKKLVAAENAVARAEKRFASLKAKHEELKVDLADKLEKLEVAKQTAEENDAKVASLTSECGRLEKLQASHENEVESLKDALAARTKELEDLRAQVDNAIQEKVTAELQRVRDEAEERYRLEAEKLKAGLADREKKARENAAVALMEELCDLGVVDYDKYEVAVQQRDVEEAAAAKAATNAEPSSSEALHSAPPESPRPVTEVANRSPSHAEGSSSSSPGGLSCNNDRFDSNPETSSPTSQEIKMQRRRERRRAARREEEQALEETDRGKDWGVGVRSTAELWLRERGPLSLKCC